jgi:hypothetical protein
MSPKKEGQYALRANISQEAIANVRKIKGAFAAAGTNYTIEQVINYILLKAKK